MSLSDTGILGPWLLLSSIMRSTSSKYVTRSKWNMSRRTSSGSMLIAVTQRSSEKNEVLGNARRAILSGIAAERLESRHRRARSIWGCW
ncbi:hypothetical protein BJV77DRAFT_1009884 [Russula vinacea]|nr:hypothetical protein BJV77DRAFT_1009884 [Russula vinacea]